MRNLDLGQQNWHAFASQDFVDGGVDIRLAIAAQLMASAMSNCNLDVLQEPRIQNALAEAALQGADVLLQKYQEREAEAPRSSGDLM